MAFSPGIYTLHSYIGETLVLDCVPQTQQVRGTFISSPQDRDKPTLQWRLELSNNDSEYLIQNVQTQQYIGVEGWEACLTSRSEATSWDFGSVRSGFGLIKLPRTTQVLTFIQKSGDSTFYAWLVFNKDDYRGLLWSFKKPSDIVDGLPDPPLAPQPQELSSNASVGPNEIVLKGSNSPYMNDAYFHTDMLFNMPRTPLIRTQRIAVLEWARKMGATDVPTMESFDECERALEAQGGSNSQPSVPRDTANPYGDDAHFHTDMLFNMPRTPFTRAQRAMTLEWLRRLGVPNVPTMKSFDTCERALNGGQSGGNNAGQG